MSLDRMRDWQLLLDEGVKHPLPPFSSNVGGPFSNMLSRIHRSEDQSSGMDELLDRFMGLQQIRHYDVSCQEDIGQNPSSADSTLNNRR